MQRFSVVILAFTQFNRAQATFGCAIAIRMGHRFIGN